MPVTFVIIPGPSLMGAHRTNCEESSLDEMALEKCLYPTAGLPWKWFDLTLSNQGQ